MPLSTTQPRVALRMSADAERYGALEPCLVVETPKEDRAGGAGMRAFLRRGRSGVLWTSSRSRWR